MSEIRWSTNLIPFGLPIDRFVSSGYRKGYPIEKRIELASKIPGLTGVELHYPTMVNEDNIEKVKVTLSSCGLVCSIVTPSLSTETKWMYGALSNPDKGLNRQAIQRVKHAMDMARELGVNAINLWPGLDGYDYPLQTHYLEFWNRLTESLQECADYDAKVKICLEYKSKEPRARVALSTVGKVLTVIHWLSKENVGCTLDVGHALMVGENPAESAMLLHREKKLFHLHLNDNYGDWDWDLIVGSIHQTEFLELFFWLEEIAYEGWYSLDQYPRREDPQQALALSIKNVQNLVEISRKLDRQILLEALKRQDYVSVFNQLRTVMF
ncbi:TIM barrel protein [Candidatus Aerophobetes bacterium]|nr:TIM barrel protein [Candidatus Aerophobetes bacterium]